ncbi:MAG: undecaprenyl-diphosphate phosphatase [Campylobacterales bacterium]
MTGSEAVVLGLLEGLTEFLPVSSTGHLILASHLMGIAQDDVHKAFEVSIQLGSILAVVVLYMKRLLAHPLLLLKLAVAFVPTGIVGLLLYKTIKSLFDSHSVAWMLILGGIVMIVIELWRKGREEPSDSVEEISLKQALMIGTFQILSMVPGTSRSAATIIGGLLAGLSRRSAAEFSFLLAVPTMIVATVYDLYKNHAAMDFSDVTNLGIGFGVAFVTALLAIRLFLSFVARFNFIPFAFYRIALGLFFLWVVL